MLIVGGGIPPSPPRIFNGGGDAHRVKGDAHPPLPYEHPSPPYVPVTPYEQLKFLVGNNLSPPSPPPAQYYLPAMTMDMGQKLKDFTLYGLCGYTTGSDESQKSNCEIVISDFESRMRKFEIPVMNFESGKRNILFIFSEGRNRNFREYE